MTENHDKEQNLAIEEYQNFRGETGAGKTEFAVFALTFGPTCYAVYYLDTSGYAWYWSVLTFFGLGALGTLIQTKVFHYLFADRLTEKRTEIRKKYPNADLSVFDDDDIR